MLAHVRDPGNAGTVLRTADAAGADAVILTDASVDPYNPKAVRASVGSLFHLPFAVGVPVEQAVAGPRAAGVRHPGRRRRGDRDLDPELDDGTLGGPGAWVFGNEAWGLPEETRPSRTPWCACRSTERPKVSTSPPPPPCASTPRRVPSAQWVLLSGCTR